MHPSWQAAHIVSTGISPSHQILPRIAAIGLLAQNLNPLILQTKLLIYAYTFPWWIPTLRFPQIGRLIRLFFLLLLSTLRTVHMNIFLTAKYNNRVMTFLPFTA